MNFIVLGAGAIGCYVGGRLALSGQHVTFVGRPRVVDALSENGLTVTDLDGFSGHIAGDRLRLKLSLRDVVFTDEPTVILLCVKGGATLAAAQEIAQEMTLRGKPGTTIVSLQNGVDNVARIQAGAPHMQVLAGMVPFNVVFDVVMSQPDRVHRATAGSLHIERSATSGQFTPLFNAAGLPTELIDDMRAVQWGKLLLNLNNPVNALSELPLQAQLRDRSLRRVFADLQSEALGVMARAGITPAQVTPVAPRVLPHLLRLPNWIFTRVAARMLRMDASARSSMADDLSKGRVTEIDDLCGAVVRLARANGLEAPLNEAMCQLIPVHTLGQAVSGSAMIKMLKAA
jgi:2-dehydropantoate 2-reductase